MISSLNSTALKILNHLVILIMIISNPLSSLATSSFLRMDLSREQTQVSVTTMLQILRFRQMRMSQVVCIVGLGCLTGVYRYVPFNIR